MSGNGKAALGHWRAQRVTAILLAPLGLWFMYSVIALAGQPYPAFHAWAGGGLNGFLLGAFAIVLFRHAQLGIEEVIQDYVHGACIKYGSLIAVRVAVAGLLGLALLSVVLIAIGE